MMFYLRLCAVLVIIAGVASGILAFVNKQTAPIIAENKRIAEEKARTEVLPAAKSFEEKSYKVSEKETLKYYIGKDEAGNVVGYTLVAFGEGYSSTLQTMVGVKTDFSIEAIKIIYQMETPGLGANCEKVDPKDETKSFAYRYKGKTKTELKVDKDGGTIASITGATITTRAITKSIQAGIENLEKALAAVN